MGNKLFRQPIPVPIAETSHLQQPYKFTFKQIKPTLSVLQWNVLAQCYSGKELFPHIKPENLEFKNRAMLVVKNIIELNPDIFTLQEVDNYKEFYQSALADSQIYDNQYFSRIVRQDGILIGWKKAKFEFLKQETIYFDEIAQLENHNRNYQRNNIAVLTILQDKITEKRLGLVSTHLFWNPKDEHIKYHQMLTLVTRINQYYVDEQIPIVFTGDFNGLPQCNGVQYVTQKSAPSQARIEIFNQKGWEEIQKEYEKHEQYNKIEFQSAYEGYRKEDKHPKFTCFTPTWFGCIDYIFHTKDLEVLQLLDLPSLDVVQRETAIPNSEIPSDHLPLMAEFIYN